MNNTVTMPEPEVFHGYASYRNPYETFGGPYSRQPYPEADWSQDPDFKKVQKEAADYEEKQLLATEFDEEYDVPPDYAQRYSAFICIASPSYTFLIWLRS
jgi:hypothetical protein